MTPPDSDARCDFPECIRGRGHELPHKTLVVNDSDAREVRTMSNEEIADMHRDIQRWRAEGFVILTPLLAQRILAALEEQSAFLLDGNDGLRAHPLNVIADELRAVIGK